MLTEELMEEVWEKFPDLKDAQEAKEKMVGLYYPGDEERSRKPCWLKEGRTLAYAQIKHTDKLYYKNCRRILSYKLMDQNTKKLFVDDREPVEKLLVVVAQHIGMKHSDEFGLRRENDKNSWLARDQTLHEQNIKDDEVLIFGQSFFGENIDQADPFHLHLAYLQCVRSIVDGDYPCPMNQAIRFAAIQAQVDCGDYDPQNPKTIVKDLCLPLEWRKEKGIEAQIVTGWKNLIRMNPQQAKYRYYMEMRNLRSFGITFYEVSQYFYEEDKKTGKLRPIERKVKFGISREILLILTLRNELISEWDIWMLKEFNLKQNIIFLDFGAHEDTLIRLSAEKPETNTSIIMLLQGYIDLILKDMNEVTKLGAFVDDDIAKVEEVDVLPQLALQGQTVSMSGKGKAGSLNSGSGNDRNLTMGGGQNIFIPGSQFGMPQGQSASPDNMLAETKLPPSQRVNIKDLNSAIKASQLLTKELGSTKALWGHKTGVMSLDMAKSQLETDRGMLDKDLKDLLGRLQLDPRGLTKGELDTKAQQLMVQMMSVASRSKTIASMTKGTNSNILDGAKAVSDSLTDMLKLMATIQEDPNDIGSIMALGEAGKTMDASMLLLQQAGTCDWLVIDEGTTLLMKQGIGQIQQATGAFLALIDEVSSRVDAKPQALIAMEKKKFVGRTDWMSKAMTHLCPALLNKDVAQQMDRIKIDYLKLVKATGKSI